MKLTLYLIKHNIEDTYGGSGGVAQKNVKVACSGWPTWYMKGGICGGWEKLGLETFVDCTWICEHA
jgi:hypothetical protein